MLDRNIFTNAEKQLDFAQSIQDPMRFSRIWQQFCWI